jgi:hypothetical protein
LSLYEKLPTEFISAFYFEIQKNIDQGILSENMNQELLLIKIALEKRGLNLMDIQPPVAFEQLEFSL